MLMKMAKSAQSKMIPRSLVVRSNRLVNQSNEENRGCQCGHATAAPGKLTRSGQKCPCYVESKRALIASVVAGG